MSTNVSAPTPPPSAVDTSKLPDDTAVLKQMIAELIRALRQSRRDQESLQQRLDALLRRYYAPRPADPNQPSLFAPPEEAAAPPASPPPPSEEESSQRGKKSRPHGRRRPARELRHEARRYELTAAERLCPTCGHERHEIGVETTCQYDYKPAEVFVIEHQRVKYACRSCQGERIG